MATASDDLFEALAALRSDPALAHVFQRRSGSDAATAPSKRSEQHADANEDEALSKGASGGNVTPPITGRLMRDSTARGGGAMDDSPALDFLRTRQSERELLGTPHWLAKHRQELSEAEQRRLENRLRAEQLFATASLQFDEYQAGMAAAPPPTENDVATAWQRIDHVYGVSPRPDATPPAAPSYVTQPPSYAGGGGGGRSEVLEADMNVSRGPPPRYSDRDVDNNDERPQKVSSSHYRPVERVTIPEDAPPPPIDAVANYEAKQRALALPTAIQVNTPPVLFYSRHAPDIDDIGQPADLQSQRRDRAQHSDDRTHVASLDVLRRAITERDETISRLERRLREQEDLYEKALLDARREHQDALRHADQRAALLEAQVQELSKSLTVSNAEAVRDAQRALADANATFTRNCESVREEMGALLKGYQAGLDARLRDVIETADVTNRACRETYIVEKAEVITHEKERLLERLAREQQLMLREAELQLGDELERQLLSKLRTDVRHYVNESAEALLIPKLRSLLGDDVEDYFGASVQTLIQARMADATRVLRSDLQSEIAAGREELQTLSSLLAAETMANSSQLVESGEIAKHKALFDELKAAAESRAEEHRRESDENSQRTKRLTEHLTRLESELNAERSVAKKLAEELITLKNTRSVLGK